MRPYKSIGDRNRELRESQRREHHQKIRHSILFNRAVENLTEATQSTTETPAQNIYLDLSNLLALLKKGEVVWASIQQQYPEIIKLAFSSLTEPTSVLVVGQLASQSDLFREVFAAMDGIPRLLSCCSQLEDGSKEQSIYIWALSEIIAGVAHLPEAEDVFKMTEQIYQGARWGEGSGIYRLLMHLSRHSGSFSPYVLHGLCEQFWVIEQQSNLVHIYITATNAVSHGNSVKHKQLFQALSRVLMEGREKLPVNILRSLPSRHKLMGDLLRLVKGECVDLGGTHMTLFHRYGELFQGGSTPDYFMFVYEYLATAEVIFDWTQIEDVLPVLKNGIIERLVVALQDNVGLMDVLRAIRVLVSNQHSGEVSTAAVCSLLLREGLREGLERLRRRVRQGRIGRFVEELLDVLPCDLNII